MVALRRAMVAGNWKMHMTRAEAGQLVRDILAHMDGVHCEVIICPPFTALQAVREICGDGTGVALGAQNVHWEEKGAFTGEIAPAMLADCGCRYVLAGHSERRQYFAETDDTVNLRTTAALKHNLVPIICVGETLDEREKDLTNAVISRQIRGAFRNIPLSEAEKTVIAYEPVWAIGTGRASNGPDANRVAGLIRETLASVYHMEMAGRIRILYGGSVKPENMAEFASEKHIDGALVGGASLTAASFAGIIRATDQATLNKQG